MRISSALGVTGALLALALPAVARAEAPARPLVRWMGPDLVDEDGRVPILVAIPPGETASSYGAIEVAPGVGSIRLAPDDAIAFGDAFPDLSLFTGPPKRPLLDVSVPRMGAKAFREMTGNGGEGAIVGVVDTGLDLTHPAFRDSNGKTRVAWLLTWGDPKGLHPEVEDAMGCTDPSQSPCAVYSAADIDQMLVSAGDVPADMRDFVGHGTHVTSIAAGNGGSKTSKPPKYIGVAPGATLVVAAPSKTGGFPDDAILRSAKFVFDRADFMAMPVALNLSVGGDFGPHDGTSLLEKGLSAFVGDDKPGHVIVVAAGNSAGLYKVGKIQPIGAHTEVHIDDHAPVTVPVITPAGANKGKVFVWITFRKGDEVSVGLEAPDGFGGHDTWIHPVGPGGDAGFNGDNSTNATIVNNEVNGLSALTSDTNGAVLAWSGQWPDGDFAITLEGHGDAQLWTVAAGELASVGSYFSHGMVEGSVATPASAPGLMAVGCIINRTSWKSLAGTPIALADSTGTDDVCFFSGAGPTPTGVPKPEILAPGGYIAGAMSVDADPRTHSGSIFDGSNACPPSDSNCYIVDEGYAVTTGTSMSAPHATGAVALLLAQDPNLTQARATDILQASGRLPNGAIPYQAQLGPGTIDLVHALAVMGEEQAATEDPSTERSWWTVSTEIVRPDTTFPVWGTIELRNADGTVASGLDGKKITVVADGGVILSQATKVRHGLFRFSIAAKEGTGGGTVHLSVLYDGVPIGAQRDLPIELDSWLDVRRPSVDGGCAFAPVSGRGAGSAASIVALALGLARVRSLRRRARRAP